MGKYLPNIVAIFLLAMGTLGSYSVGSLSIGSPSPAFAEEPTQQQDENAGLADLDKATQTKLTAESAQHLANVIDLCESALRKGLSEEHSVLAKQLLVGTRYERASIFSSMIFDRRPPRERWAQYQTLAVTDLQEALAHDPDNIQVLVLMGRLYTLSRDDKDREQAITALTKVIELSDDIQQKSKALAYRAAARSDAKQRDADLNESIELDPKNLEAIRTRAMVRVEAHEYETAVDDLEKAIELDAENPRMHEILAVTLMALGKNDAAIERLGIAIKLAPDSPSAYAQRSRIYFIDKKYKLALEDSDSAHKLAPRNPAVQLLHAKNLQLDGQTKESLRLVTKVLVVNPRLISAIEMRASLLADEGRFAEAITEVQKAFDRDPENMRLLGTLATLYAANKQMIKAIELYDRLLAGGFKIAAIYRNRADSLLSLGRQSEALADYQKAHELDPKDAGILNNLAWLMATSPDDTLRDGKKALELATESCLLTEYKKAYILSTLAAAHAESGDFAKAIKWAEKAVELSGEDVVEQLRAELNSYRRNEPWREKQEGAEKQEEEEDPKEDAPEEPEAKKPAPADSDEPASDEDEFRPPNAD